MTQHPFELIVPGELGRPVKPKVGGAPDKLILGVPYVGQTAQLVLGCVRDDARSVHAKGHLKLCQAASALIPDGNCCTGAPPEGRFNDDWDNPTCNRTSMASKVQQLHEMLGMQSTACWRHDNFDQLHDQIAGSGHPVEVEFR